MYTRLIGMVVAVVVFAVAAQAENQTWVDGGADKVWSTNAANWASGGVWTNGNSAFFSGGAGTRFGETVDIAATVTVANVTFQTNGYVIADANKDGSFSVVGAPSVFTVVNAGDTGTVSAAISGSGGLTKSGNGVLNLTATNTYTGTTTVHAGILRLQSGILQGLGATGTGNDTVIDDGATIDFNGCYKDSSTSEKFTISGAGTDGKGVLINNGTGHTNKSLGDTTLLADAVIGGPNRIDISNIIGNDHTLTKVGSGQLCTKNVQNATIVLNEGKITILDDTRALGGTTPGDTTVNGGYLDCWNTYFISERITFNGGAISEGNTANTFYLTGHLTVNSNVVVNSTSSRGVEISGFVDGPGGFTQSGDGWFIVTCDTNTYSGPTTVSSGKSLWVGRTNLNAGVLGSGAVTNWGTLYAYSPKLGSGEVVNRGTLFCNAPVLDSGRIVNMGTLYGTSILQVANGIVNSGTLHCFSGVLGSGVVTNYGTLNAYTNFLTFGQLVNHGTLNILQPMTLSSPVTFNGGTVAVSSNALMIAGPVTVNTNTSFSSTSTGAIEISGAIDGAGGFTQGGDGGLYLTSDANTYSGSTLINSGKTLVVGKTLGATGSLGSGSVTNWGTLYANSERLCNGSVVNYGTLYWNGGLLSGAGDIVNNNNLYIDRSGAFVCSNAFFGTGVIYLRYGGDMTVSGSLSSNTQFRIGSGTLTLTNGADFCCYQEMQVADRLNLNYPITDPSNLTAVINVPEGCTLTAQAITFGNGVYSSLTGILNQAGGVVRTTGAAAEGNGIRLGHYPVTYSVYNMMGGSLFVEKDYDLSCATDGKGWFNMTGGQVFTTRVMLNERDSTAGYGRLTVAGGVLNVGSLSGTVSAISNAITADLYGPYLIEYGGGGGIVRAVTNLYLPLNATLYGTGTNAVTFDTSSFAIYQSGNLSGAGGLNKTGLGTLVLSGTNTYAGETRILEGIVVPTAAAALSTNSVVAFGVAADGVGGILSLPDGFSLANYTVGVANPETLDKSRNYTIASWSGSLTGMFGASALPSPWYVYYDWAGQTAQLRSAIGTLIRLQ